MFQEPEHSHRKFRWQLVQVEEVGGRGGEGKEVEEGGEADEVEEERKVEEEGEEEEEEEEGGSEGEQAVLVYYKRGVYLNSNATLKDLREGFLDTGKCVYTCVHEYISLRSCGLQCLPQSMHITI